MADQITPDEAREELHAAMDFASACMAGCDPAKVTAIAAAFYQTVRACGSDDQVATAVACCVILNSWGGFKKKETGNRIVRPF